MPRRRTIDQERKLKVLILDQGSQDIVATLIIGNINFTTKFSQQQAQKASLIPGRKLALEYQIHEVQWL